jgi:hypothetical protein
MTRCFATFLAFAAALRLAAAEIPDTDQPWTNSPVAGVPAATAPAPAAKPAPKPTHASASAQSQAQLQAALDQLTQTNHELLDLLKKQQAVLEDIQFDRRLQSRQIAALEDRLEEALADRRALQQKVDDLEVQASTRPAAPSTSAPGTGASTPVAPPQTPPNPGAAIVTPTVESVPPATNAPVAETPPPASYLPPPGSDGPPGSLTWHRLFTLKGEDNKQTDVFLVHGKNWRVLWHNQDKPGKLYENTSALFINAFPRDDTIPQKVCAKLGTGGDSAELPGPGYYYLKIEASGGDWEIAVEDFR